MKMANIIITGGSGFIGKQAVRAALERGHNVAVLDSQKPKGLEGILFEECDITSEGSVHDAFYRIYTAFDDHIDAVEHFAAAFNYSKPYHFLRRVNVAGTDIVAANAELLGVEKFLNMGAVAEYEEGNEGPIKESTPLAPCEFYGKTKHEAEELLFEKYHRPGKLKVATFRSVMVYGPDALGSYIDGLFNMIKNSKGPVIVPMKDTRNSYVHTYDIGRAFTHAVEHDSAFIEDAKELNDIAYNLADEHAVSEHNIVKMIIGLMPDDRKRFLLPIVPHSFLKIAAAASEYVEGFFKERTSLPKGVVIHSAHNHMLDNSKFKKRTGFRYYYPTTYTGMINVVNWYYDNVWKKNS